MQPNKPKVPLSLADREIKVNVTDDLVLLLFWCDRPPISIQLSVESAAELGKRLCEAIKAKVATVEAQQKATLN